MKKRLSNKLVPTKVGVIAIVVVLIVVLLLIFLQYNNGHFSLRKRYYHSRAKSKKDLLVSLSYYKSEKAKKNIGGTKYDKMIATILFKLGKIDIQDSNWESARKNLEEAFLNNRQSAGILKNLGMVYSTLFLSEKDTEERKKFLKKSIESYHRSLVIDSSQREPKYALGVIHYYYDTGMKDRRQLAIRYMHEAIDADAKFKEAFIRLGQFYYGVNDYQNSLKYYRLAKNLLNKKTESNLYSGIVKNIEKVQAKTMFWKK